MLNNYTDAKTDSWENYEGKVIKHDSKFLNGNGLINSDTVSAKPSLKVQFAAIESKFLL